MRCPGCGIELSEFYRFCSNCGAIIAQPIDLRDPALNEPREQIMRASAKRLQTDRHMAPIWIIILAVAVLVVTIGYYIVMVASILADPFEYSGTDAYVNALIVFSIFSAFVSILLAFFAFFLIKRLNEHYSRERELRTGIVELVRSAAIRTQRYDSVAGDMRVMEVDHHTVERQREPAVWAILVGITAFPSLYSAITAMVALESDSVSISFGWIVTGSIVSALVSLVALIAKLYMLYFLSKDLYDHDVRWNSFSLAARTALTKLGFPKGSPFDVRIVPSRNPVLYVVLSLFIPFFEYYWWYAVFKDPNEHFDTQRSFEDHLVSAIRTDLTSSAWMR